MSSRTKLTDRHSPRVVVAIVVLCVAAFSVGAQEYPAYIDPEGVREIETQIGQGDYPLPTTITLPRDVDEFPVVVFLSGSGPNVRDGVIGPNRIYRDMAWGLANEGIASVRFDKRTTHFGVSAAQDNPGEFDYMGWEYAEDAARAIDLARDIEGARSVVLIGHSLGATVAPRIAAEQDVDALAMIAGAARQFAQILLDQNLYFAEQMEQTEELQQQMASATAFFEAVKRQEVPPETLVQPGLPVAYYYAVDEYLPQDYLPEFSGPVLITQGSDDFQSLVDKDYSVLEDQFGAESRITFRLFDGLNHLMMESSGPGAGMADYARPGFVDPEFIGVLADWILAN